MFVTNVVVAQMDEGKKTNKSPMKKIIKPCEKKIINHIYVKICKALSTLNTHHEMGKNGLWNAFANMNIFFKFTLILNINNNYLRSYI